MIKGVILVGGPLKGTRFRPLSLDNPKPLFEVAGLPIIQHHIEACASVPDLKEVLIIGYYPATEFSTFIAEMVQEYKINIRYLQEFTALGTGGGMYHFRDFIRSGNPSAFFVLNGDVCADFPLNEMLRNHGNNCDVLGTLLVTEATRSQSVNYGCVVQDKETKEITHYVEKPSTFVSALINCGVYLLSIDIFSIMSAVFDQKQNEYYSGLQNGNGNLSSIINLEKDVFMPLAGTGRLYAYQTDNWWSQLKTAGSAIYANRHYLALHRVKKPKRLTHPDDGKCSILGDVYIHPSATVDVSCVLGPNVSIGQNAVVKAGTRIRETIVLDGATIEEHCLIIHSIVGSGSHVGKWSRVEGTPCDPNPNKLFAKMDNVALFNADGRLNPSITILGSSVVVPSEVILLNSIVLPNKELTRSIKNEIVL